ncbi:hypothetical protein HYH03_017536 [Edaphochlamys debaryana]|uniref:Glycosyl transferase CAP10 domain-containing protein n=1 Tax=Edaphochlamys debaryana TaxID=47281 RepID=A0A836BQB2_9CHLO|nr:hypothetical protein HYH03_017536 [Edaphochlamys debaryana]|eukprot:KAG2483594.1 hypothetical protein HYH03_017536 [Edaphochlamys debaryana]
MAALQAAFKKAVDAGAQFPNVLFLMDLENGGSCRVEEQCPAPILAFFQVIRGPPYNMTVHVPYGKGSILVPDLAHAELPDPVSADWGAKLPKAIFRGPGHCPGFHSNPLLQCSRRELHKLANRTEGSRFLDVKVWDEEDVHIDDTREGGWPELYAKYQFTLALDGHSGCMRLEELLRINSVVLKEFSPVVEFYTRALKAGEHYLDIGRDSSTDVLQVIQSTSRADGERITAKALAFADSYLCETAKLAYFQKALERYQALFEGMDEFIEEKVWPLILARQKLGLGKHGTVIVPWRR